MKTKRTDGRQTEYPNKKYGVSSFLRDDVGELSIMRLMFVLMVLMILGIRIWGCIIENKFIPWDWPEVSLLSSCFGGKALQTKYEGMSRQFFDSTQEEPPRSRYSSSEE